MNMRQRKVNACGDKYQGKRKSERKIIPIELDEHLPTGKTMVTFLRMSGILKSVL
jgi:hypothetical protein